MEKQSAADFEWAIDGAPVALRRVLPTRLGGRAGRLQVRRGRVWVTRSRELDDHVLGPGESIVIDDPGQVVVEPWDAAAAALVTWRPEPRAASWLAAARRMPASASARLLATALRVVTSGIDGLERLRSRLERLRGAAPACARTIAAPAASAR